MSKSILDDVWTMYTISPDPASGTPTLRDTCAVLLSYTLSSSDIIPGSAGFTLHPRLANPLHQSSSDLKRLTVALGQPHIVDLVDSRIALGPTSLDWKIFLAWDRLVKQLAAAIKLVETACTLPEPHHFTTLPLHAHVQPSAPPQTPIAANSGSWWMAPAPPFKSSKSFFADLSKASGFMPSKDTIDTSEPNVLFRLACGPMGNVGEAFIRKFKDAPASPRPTLAPTHPPAVRSRPSNPSLVFTPVARPAASAPQRDVPLRQAGHSVEEVLDHGATCHAEAAPIENGAVPGKGLVVKQAEWASTHENIGALLAGPRTLLASTPTVPSSSEMARATQDAGSSPRRDVPLRQAGRAVEEVLDNGATRCVESAPAGSDAVPVKELARERGESAGTHKSVKPSTSPAGRATARASSSSLPSPSPSADSATSWRSTARALKSWSPVTSPASSSSSWRSIARVARPPGNYAPRREVPSRQADRVVEEVLDNGATCRAEFPQELRDKARHIHAGLDLKDHTRAARKWELEKKRIVVDTGGMNTQVSSVHIQSAETRTMTPAVCAAPELEFVTLARPAVIAQEKLRPRQAVADVGVRCGSHAAEDKTSVSTQKGGQMLVHVPRPPSVQVANSLLRADPVRSLEVCVGASTAAAVDHGGLDHPSSPVTRLGPASKRAASIIASDVGKERLANALAALHAHHSSNPPLDALAAPGNNGEISPTLRSGGVNSASPITSDSSRERVSQRQDPSVAGYVPADSPSLAEDTQAATTKTSIADELRTRERIWSGVSIVPKKSVSTREQGESLGDAPCHPSPPSLRRAPRTSILGTRAFAKPNATSANEDGMCVERTRASLVTVTEPGGLTLVPRDSAVEENEISPALSDARARSPYTALSESDDLTMIAAAQQSLRADSNWITYYSL
ncbi:hypothetical protein B0H13DRAFT_2394891 [Mycena leptocephala]|nr:hypothetical protein B0H13DRAFT_2394891 [Mycena leptocephala]